MLGVPREPYFPEICPLFHITQFSLQNLTQLIFQFFNQVYKDSSKQRHKNFIVCTWSISLNWTFLIKWIWLFLQYWWEPKQLTILSFAKRHSKVKRRELEKADDYQLHHGWNYARIISLIASTFTLSAYQTLHQRNTCCQPSKTIINSIVIVVVTINVTESKSL